MYASELGLRPGDDFEILLSADEQPGTWLPLDPDAAFVHVRDYYFDWLPPEPATFVIERLDTQGDPPRRSPPSGSREMLDDAAHEVEHSLVYFRDYQEKLRASGGAEHVRRAGVLGRGVQDIIYSHGFVSLRDDEALVVELDPADASLWDVSSTTARGTSRSTTRPGSPAATTARCSPTTTASCASSSPITTPAPPTGSTPKGRAEVLTTVRWFRPPAQPSVRAQIVPRAATHRAPPARHRHRRRPGAPRPSAPARRAHRVALPELSPIREDAPMTDRDLFLHEFIDIIGHAPVGLHGAHAPAVG